MTMEGNGGGIGMVQYIERLENGAVMGGETDGCGCVMCAYGG